MSTMTNEFKVRVAKALVQSNEVYKGEFKTVAELDKIPAYEGDYADVYETNTRWQYKNGAWTNTGDAIPTNPAYIEANDISISTKPNTLVQRDEQGHAYFADPDAPKQGATKGYTDKADKVLADAINQEVATRQQDVSDIHQALNAEVERATNKENALETSVQELNTDIEAEIIRAQQAEADLQTAIDNNAQAINAEQSRAEGQEEALLQRINTLKTDTDAVQANITKSLNDEITRAQQAENALSEETATKLARVENTADKQRAYTVQTNGEQAMLDVDMNASSNTLVQRNANGQINAADPIQDSNAATKKYVDDADKDLFLKFTNDLPVANPTDAGTDTLTKLKVGDVVYNIPQGGTVDAYTKAETNALLDTKANVSDIPTVSTLGQTGQLKDGVQDATHRLVTDTEKSTWNSKQTQLTDDQLNAVNSGITATKVSTYDGYATAINNKVDKVTGKGLSTNDFTNDEKNKLAGIETGAQKNTITGVKGSAETSYRIGDINITKTNIGLGNVDDVKQYSATNPNFGSTSPLMDGTASAGSATTYARSDHTHPTDTSRASTAVATTSTNGLMSSLDKTKLDGIETGAQVNDIIIAGENVTVSKDGRNVTISATGGTTVVANPTLAGTETDLTGLEVAGTKYKVPTGGGTEVVANPTGNATVVLLKLQVGSTIYSIPVYTLPVASSSALGGIKSQTAGTDGTNYPVEVDSSGNAKVNVKTNTFTVTENTDGTVDLTIA